MPVFTLNTNPHIDTTGSYPSGTYNVGDEIRLEEDSARWYRFEWFEITGGGTSYIITDPVYWESYYAFNMPNYDVSATPLSSLIQYNIVMNDPYYSYPPERVNPNVDYYTIETPTFTLSRPTKTWYTFIWWAWSNWSVPQLDVTIEQWTAWDKVYYANWDALEVQYTVYHMLEGGTTYTETLTGYSGTYTQAVAHNYPWYEQYGQINQRIINGDWSTYVMILYRRVTPVTWWWIMINGQALSKRYINWQEVQKVMVNGSQVRPI